MAEDSQRGFNINVFRAELNNKKVLRPNLFHVEFSLPPGLLIQHKGFDNNIETMKTLEYWCEATSLPGFSLNTYQGQRYGYGAIEQRPIIPAYGEQQFVFIFDSRALNYDLFNDWLNIIVNTNMSQGPNDLSGEVARDGKKVTMSPYELTFRDDYITDTSIIVYDQQGNAKKKITLRDSFPKTLGEISVAWADNNSYMRLPISFAYTDWFHTPITDPEKIIRPPNPNEYFMKE